MNAPKKYTKVNGVLKLNPEYKRWKEQFGDGATGQTNRVSKVQMNIYASNLRNVAGLGKGTSDPFAVVTLLANDSTTEPKIIGKTEVIKNDLSPKWTTSFVLDYTLGVNTRINIGIFDEIRKGNKVKPMGSAMFEIGEVLGAKGSVKAKKLKQGGTLFVHAIAAPTEDAGRLMLKLQGHKLKNVDGMFSKSDPFVEISAKVNSAGGLTWHPVYRSKHIDNTLNPVWDEMDLNINKLCQGDKNAPILISVFDWEKSGKHKAMGSFETSVNALMLSVVPPGKNPDTSRAYSLYKGSQLYGKIVVTGATISGANLLPVTTGYNTPNAGPSVPAPTPPPPPAYNNPPPTTTAAATAAAVVAGPGNNNKVPSYGSMPVQIAPPMMPPGASTSGSLRPKFVDYLTGGCELQMCVAIDFTGSNGDPRQPGTLHYIHRDGGLNDYEKAITAVGSVVARFDADQKFPVWGFGAKYGGVIQHCFQVGRTPEVDGISGILEGYRGVFRTGLTMSGPTVFADVIGMAAQQARAKQAENARIGKQSYYILLILTDGAVTDVEQTKRAITAASDAPLSIIIVGIGQADFSTMQFLDDFQAMEEGAAGRDICQFVEFSRHQHNRSALTEETLAEVPDQLVDYFWDANGIRPLPPLSGSKFSVMEAEHDSLIDVDIQLDFNDNGNINILNPQAGVFDDTKYGTYNQYAAGGGGSGGAMASAPVAPQVFQVQVPPNGYPGMQLQVQNPFTGQTQLVTVPPGIQAGQTFAVA